MYEDYKKMVVELASSNTNQLIPNVNPLNVSSLITQMLWHAKESVVIFAKNLDDVIFGDSEITSAAHYALYLGRKLKVLVQEAPGPNSSVFFKALRERAGFEIRLAQGNYAKPDARYLVVMDTTGFRFEDPVSTDPANCPVANFNDPSTAFALLEAFLKAFEIGTPLLDTPNPSV